MPRAEAELENRAHRSTPLPGRRPSPLDILANAYFVANRVCARRGAAFPDQAVGGRRTPRRLLGGDRTLSSTMRSLRRSSGSRREPRPGWIWASRAPHLIEPVLAVVGIGSPVAVHGVDRGRLADHVPPRRGGGARAEGARASIHPGPVASALVSLLSSGARPASCCVGDERARQCARRACSGRRRSAKERSALAQELSSPASEAREAGEIRRTRGPHPRQRLSHRASACAT